ncbi:GWT1-domain-containing protein [Schizopora paradoxa]|uniref:GPI-anchored wall transfer protein n=1 Tax=Schizopora paradoxa TaxID=27342 RepID=A0A0H2R7L7_9AGAM|nr:GWT1-domain-containing protein [Schizopora paradoxa]
MDDDYKSAKEAFVSDLTGSSIIYVNLVSSAAVASLLLHAAVRSRFNIKPNLFIEWLLLVVPLLLSMTVFALQPTRLYSSLLFAAVVIQTTLPSRPEAPLLSDSNTNVQDSPQSHSRQRSDGPAPNSGSRHVTIRPLPALTIYRAHMMLMTMLAILAVDFPVFPRKLAKCETFGVSLMDIGVGSFVFSQGVVSAIPILKDPQRLAMPVVPKILSVSKKVLPLVVLGIMRLISVKGTDYPEHESEYGRHWNFFFTMAAVPILEVLCHKAMTHASISFVGFSIALVHQLALSLTPLQEYTLNAGRIGIISSNKEGLVSLLGYLAMHLIGLATGTVLLPASPSEFRRLKRSLFQKSKEENPDANSNKPRFRQNDKIAIELFSYAALWWISLGIVSVLNVGGGVSRRLANLPYVLWVCAYNTSFILCYLISDVMFYSRIPSNQSSEISGGKRVSTPSILLDAINRNGLVLFLAANILTGLVNLSVRTMYASDAFAMVILLSYSFAICGLAWIAKTRRLWLP